MTNLAAESGKNKESDMLQPTQSNSHPPEPSHYMSHLQSLIWWQQKPPAWLDCAWGASRAGTEESLAGKTSFRHASYAAPPCQLPSTLIRKRYSTSNPGNVKFCRPTLLCNASTGGAAQTQPGLLTVATGTAEVLGANELGAAKPACAAWTEELLWARPTTERFC